MSEHLVICIPRDDTSLEVTVDAFTDSGAAQDAFFVAEAKGYYAEVLTIYRHPLKNGTMGDWWGGMWTGYGRRNGVTPSESSAPGVALGRHGNPPPDEPSSPPPSIRVEEIVEVLNGVSLHLRAVSDWMNGQQLLPRLTPFAYLLTARHELNFLLSKLGQEGGVR